MDTATLLDEVLMDFDKLDPSELADPFYVNLRAMALRYAQSVVDEIWQAYNFSWRHGTGTVTISAGTGFANGIGPLPSNFVAFGHGGIVYAAGQGRAPLRWQQPHDLVRMRIGTRTDSFPIYYSVLQESTSGLKTIAVYPYLQSPVVLSLFYEKLRPVLADTTTPSGLEEIPEFCHRTLVKEGVIMRRMRDTGDIRSATEQRAVWQKGLTEMIKAEIASKGEVLRNPPYPGAWMNYTPYSGY